MDVERETLVEAAVSTGAVVVFVALLVVVGVLFGNDDVGGAGAFAVLGVLVFFVLLMTGVGYWLANRPDSS